MMLRDARAGDVYEMATVMDGWIAETPWMPKLRSFDETVEFLHGLVKAQVVRVGFAGGMGFLALQDGKVTALYVAAEARGKGLGKALLDEAKRKGPLGLWTFQANADARRFYVREGFRETLTTDGEGNDEGLPDVWLEWQP